MSDKATVERLAEELARFEAHAQGFGLMNAHGLYGEASIKAQAALRVALDRADSARRDYDRAFRQWELNGFPEPALDKSEAACDSTGPT